MFTVNDIEDEARKIIGACNDEKFFRWIGDSASLIVNKGDFEGLKGTLDICTTGCSSCTPTRPCSSLCCGKKLIALPPEVSTVHAVNIGGKPTLGFGQLFLFHLNGPGDCNLSCDYSWYDDGSNHPTTRDLVVPSKVVVHLEKADDNGKQFIVYGYDDAGLMLRRKVGDEWKNGYQVPTIHGYAIPDTEAPTIGRITGIFKERSAGSMRLSTTDDSGSTGTTLGVYEPDQEIPQFRRMKINRACNWVRISYMKNPGSFHSLSDHIPLQSRIAFLLAVQARKHYSDRMWAEAHAAEADAARLEIEAQMKLEAPLHFPMQVIDRNNLRDKADFEEIR